MKYLKKFNTHTEYEEARQNLILPNVSLCAQENEVHYNPWVETMVVAKYNVTESTKTQMILGFRQTGPSSSGITTAFTNVYVDGNKIEISDANVNYTFDTVGEHTVKYELKDPTRINADAFNGHINGNFSGVKAVSITIPGSVTYIGSAAFSSCSSLSTITSYIMNAPSVLGGTFLGVSHDGTLYVPIGSSGYETWMNDQGNLGIYNWTKVEQ